MLLANRKEIKSFSEHAHLIQMFLSERGNLSEYLQKFIKQYYLLSNNEISVFQIDSSFVDEIFHLASHHKEEMSNFEVNSISSENWEDIKNFLLDEV